MRQCGEVLKRDPVCPVQVLDNEQQRPLRARLLRQADEGVGAATCSREVIHAFVEAARGCRLWQVKQVGQERALRQRRARLGHDALQRCEAMIRGRVRRKIEHAGDEVADRIATLSDAEVEYQAGVMGKAFGLRRATQLADQARLAHPGVAAHEQRGTPAAGRAVPQQRGHLRELSLPADESLQVCRRAFADLLQPPHSQWSVDALDAGIGDWFAARNALHRRVHRVVEQRLAGSRKLQQPCRQVHRITDDGIRAMPPTAQPAGDHLARGNADVHRQRPPQLGAQ